MEYSTTTSPFYNHDMDKHVSAITKTTKLSEGTWLYENEDKIVLALSPATCCGLLLCCCLQLLSSYFHVFVPSI